MDEAYGVAFDSNGNIGVVGSEMWPGKTRFDDWQVRDYTPDGKLIWNDSYDGPLHENDKAYSVSFDPFRSLWKYDCWGI